MAKDKAYKLAEQALNRAQRNNPSPVSPKGEKPQADTMLNHKTIQSTSNQFSPLGEMPEGQRGK
jgi:hypothetical protein